LAIAVGVVPVVSGAASAVVTPGVTAVEYVSGAAAERATGDVAPLVNNFLTYNFPGEVSESGHFACNKGEIYFPLPQPLVVESVRNNCEFRAFLDSPTAEDCVSPKTTRDINLREFQLPQAIRIGTSTAPC
jgi:hypothetical protein